MVTIFNSIALVILGITLVIQIHMLVRLYATSVRLKEQSREIDLLALKNMEEAHEMEMKLMEREMHPEVDMKITSMDDYVMYDPEVWEPQDTWRPGPDEDER